MLVLVLDAGCWRREEAQRKILRPRPGFCRSLSLFFSLCLLVAQGVGVSSSLLPASLFKHCSTGHPPTDAEDHTLREIRAVMPTVAVLPPHVCHRLETGLSSLAYTCSRTLTFLCELKSTRVTNIDLRKKMR